MIQDLDLAYRLEIVLIAERLVKRAWDRGILAPRAALEMLNVEFEKISNPLVDLPGMVAENPVAGVRLDKTTRR